MNIGIFTDTFIPQINGVATSISMLEKELRALGHNVYIFTTTDPKAKKSEGNIIRLPSMPFVFMPQARVTLAYPPSVLNKIRKYKLDIVHTHTEFALGFFGKAVSTALKIPLIHTYHTLWEEYVHYIARGYLIKPAGARKFSKFFCECAKVVVTPTEKSRDLLVSYGVSRSIKIIPTGIDFEPFLRGPNSETEIKTLKRSLGIAEDSYVITFIGRVAKEKNIDIILHTMPEIIKSLPNAILLIVGDGPVRENLEKLVKELNIDKNVIFAGFRPWSTIGKYYHIADIFTSASETETQGLTYIEAMAAGTPVVAKFDASIEGIIKHKETGYFFYDNNDIAETIINALENKEERANIAITARNSIKHLSSKEFAKNMEILYQQVCRAYPKKTKKFFDKFVFWNQKNV